jgi:DNA end-binding protein Ku
MYVVIREAITRSQRLALSRVVIARHERPVVIRPMGRGLVAHTLHETRDIYDATELFTGIPATRRTPDFRRGDGQKYFLSA